MKITQKDLAKLETGEWRAVAVTVGSSYGGEVVDIATSDLVTQGDKWTVEPFGIGYSQPGVEGPGDDIATNYVGPVAYIEEVVRRSGEINDPWSDNPVQYARGVALGYRNLVPHDVALRDHDGRMVRFASQGSLRATGVDPLAWTASDNVPMITPPCFTGTDGPEIAPGDKVVVSFLAAPVLRQRLDVGVYTPDTSPDSVIRTADGQPGSVCRLVSWSPTIVAAQVWPDGCVEWFDPDNDESGRFDAENAGIHGGWSAMDVMWARFYEQSIVIWGQVSRVAAAVKEVLAQLNYPQPGTDRVQAIAQEIRNLTG